MAPNSVTQIPYQNDAKARNEIQPKKSSNKHKEIVWRNVILFVILHLTALYGIYLAITSAKLLTLIYGYFLYIVGGLGITAGAHRLWSHKSYKANVPLRIILMLFNTLAFQNSIHEWSRDHRVHHKFSETDADPHNATRGLFFSHIGWLLVKKHPDVREKGKTIDLSDLDRDPVVAFQKKYYLILMPFLCFILPTLVPVYLWNESWKNAFVVSTILRYTITLNWTWTVNSLAHFYGDKPFDKFMNPAQNFTVALGALGEGWHNYHHVFPWDYKAAELGNYRTNLTTMFIDFFAKIGWAYDLKTVSPEVIVRRATRTGDGSYTPPDHYPKISAEHINKLVKEEEHEDHVWGWDDKDMDPMEKSMATVVNKEQT